jgi:DNA-binding GntR family transcriptional regulator
MSKASELVVDQVRDRILQGEYAPGDRLGEVELAEKLGVSRTPVREALRRLTAEGLVDLVPNKGARVVEYPRRDLDQIFAIRARVEGLAAREAARTASDAEIDHLEQVATELKEHSEAGRLEEVYRLNSEFHGSLNALAGSSVLTATVGQLIHSSVLSRTLHSFDEAARQRSANHHLEICAALRARDPDWAEAVMTAHLMSARASLLGPRPLDHDDEEHA